jgi:hypothetical protein
MPTSPPSRRLEAGASEPESRKSPCAMQVLVGQLCWLRVPRRLRKVCPPRWGILQCLQGAYYIPSVPGIFEVVSDRAPSQTRACKAHRVHRGHYKQFCRESGRYFEARKTATAPERFLVAEPIEINLHPVVQAEDAQDPWLGFEDLVEQVSAQGSGHDSNQEMDAVQRPSTPPPAESTYESRDPFMGFIDIPSPTDSFWGETPWVPR